MNTNSRRFDVNNRYRVQNNNTYIPSSKRKREDDNYTNDSQLQNNSLDYPGYGERSQVNTSSEYNQPGTSSCLPQSTWNRPNSDSFQSNNKFYDTTYNYSGTSYSSNKFNSSIKSFNDVERSSTNKSFFNSKPNSRRPLLQTPYDNNKYSANSRLKRLRDNLTESRTNDLPSRYIPISQASTLSQWPNTYLAKSTGIQNRLTKYGSTSHEKRSTIDTDLNKFIPRTATKPADNTDLPFSNVKLPCNTVSSEVSSTGSNEIQDKVECMDWSPIDVQEILVNVEDIRRNIKDDKKFVPHTPLQQTFANCTTEFQLNKNLCKTLYIVIDTNIFISKLILVKQLLKLKINGVVNPIVFIPWMVIQELDYLKDGKSGGKLKLPAGWAVKFINKELSAKNPQLQGQSVRDAAKIELTSSSPDDGILHCLLQIVENGNRPYLLSNDINLRNKAILNGVEAFSQDEILKELDPYDNNKFRNFIPKEDSEDIKQIKIHLSNLFTYIIIKEVHGNNTAPPIQITTSPPPWSLWECLNLFKKYWMAVFSRKLQKQCIHVIENFIQLIKEENCGVTNGYKENLIELGLGLCVYIKNGLSMYSGSVNDCVKMIEQQKDDFSF